MPVKLLDWYIIEVILGCHFVDIPSVVEAQLYNLPQLLRVRLQSSCRSLLEGPVVEGFVVTQHNLNLFQDPSNRNSFLSNSSVLDWVYSNHKIFGYKELLPTNKTTLILNPPRAFSTPSVIPRQLSIHIVSSNDHLISTKLGR